MGYRTPKEQRAAFEAQEARLRTIEIKVPKDWDHGRALAALTALHQGKIEGDAYHLLTAVARGFDLALVKRCTRCGGELSWHAGMGVWLTRQPGRVLRPVPCRHDRAPEGTPEA